MSGTTSADAYAHYRQLCGEAPVLTPDELRAAIRAACLRDEDPDAAFWAALFRRPDHQHLDHSTQGERDAWQAGAWAEHDRWRSQGRAERDAWKEAASESGQPRWWEAKGRDAC